MKFAVVAVVLLVTIVLAVSAAAWTLPEGGWDVGLEVMSLTDSTARDVAGTGFGVSVRKQVLEGIGSIPDLKLFVDVGYIRFDHDWSGVNVKESVAPIMATAVRETKNFYYGGGLGFVLTHMDVSGMSESKTNGGFKLLVGKNFNNLFAEVKYLHGGITGNTGLGLRVGGRF